MEWASLSMSRRGNCHDNAVGDSFFNPRKGEPRKGERIRHKVDVFD
ncbi:hypothetical protein ACLBXM_06525 [Xanthobacteraceae bacterium A53D]